MKKISLYELIPHAANDVARDYSNHEPFSKLNPSATDEEKQNANSISTEKKKDKADKLGYYDKPLEEVEDDVIRELIRQARWVNQKRNDILDGDNEVTSFTEENLNNWLETAYDIGSEMIDNIRYDSDYDAADNFPNDNKNIENGLPQASIMSPENQDLMIDKLQEKYNEAFEKDFETPDINTAAELDHYKQQLENLEDVDYNDTGIIYYDKNGNLKFVHLDLSYM
jgi:hypothetical protein